MLNIYYVNLDLIDKFPEIEFLSEYRKNKLKKITNQKAIKQGIGAELLLIEALRLSGACPDLPLKITANEDGKPEIPGSLQFNLSHSGKYVACAVSDSPVGIDIQRVINYNEKLGTRFFSESENIWLRKSRDNLSFTTVWSIKESYIKLSGKGIAGCPLNSFSVQPGVAPGGFRVTDGETRCWHGKIEDYVLTFCSKNYAQPDEIREIGLENYL